MAGRHSKDEKFMARALELAELGRGCTGANPLVGAVVVRDGKIIGEGYHRRCGEAHAEVNALASVGDPELLRGSSLYVSLEPCHHWGKTPPCTKAIVESGISRVVFAACEEHGKASGGGAYLAGEGIQVVSGLLEEEAVEQNRIFFTGIRHHRPYVTVKGAVSLDGFLATSSGQSQWITSEEARRDGHRLRGQVDAILVGTGTVLADDPQLTNRSGEGTQPLRVVLDRRGRIPPTAKIFGGEAKTLVITTREDHHFSERMLLTEGEWQLSTILELLKDRGVHHLMVEGGARLLGSFFQEDLVDEFRLYYAPFFMGEGRKLLEGFGLEELRQRRDFGHIEATVLTDGSGNIRVEGRRNVYRAR
ncbi:MAG: bifunctional diaminohydroxyphosphoribosylaminopyrimidine deaminase/5-amino-6-(5-phosphoribosylamino)uracil reductase RibD [Tissierellia bacterium]|nr:bifunctional diaminohydroxyphosphoribosylaminopyrimidine deaminase/5-amino-6-(5-phosphoribosylamino)uracil reductase RibD [Tissierellia bacterium]